MARRAAAPRRELLGEHWKAGSRPPSFLHRAALQRAAASGGERPVERWRTVDGWRAPSSREASSGSDDERILPDQRTASTPTPLPHGQLQRALAQPAARRPLSFAGGFMLVHGMHLHEQVALRAMSGAASHGAASTEQWSGEPRSDGTLRLMRAAALLRPATPGRERWCDGQPPRRELLGEHRKAASEPSSFPQRASTPASSGEHPVERWRAVDGRRAPSSREASSGSDDERILPDQRPTAHQHLFLTGDSSELGATGGTPTSLLRLAASCLCMVCNLHERWL
ncbi:hypothetical protein Dimus_033086 [Dionaea muscipula]